MATLPDHNTVRSVIFSPNGRCVAYILEKSKGLVSLVLNGQEGKPYPGIGGLSFSPDGSRFAYVVGITENRQFIILDGVEGPYFPSVYGFRFSPDGKRTGYKAKKAIGPKTWCWHDIIDGAGGVSCNTYSSDIVFSAEGGHYGYSSDVDGGRSDVLVIDGMLQKLPHSVIHNTLIFSRDGRRHAYVADHWTSEGRQQYAVIDGKPGAPYNYVTGLTFSPDGQRIAYIAAIDGEHRSIWSPLFGPDGRRMIGRDYQGGRWFVVVNESRGNPCDEIRALGFSQDGLHLSYVARSKDQWGATVDGIGGATFQADSIYGCVFSPDVRRYALVAQSGEGYRVIIDGIPDKERAVPRINSFVFSPDGRHLAYVAEYGDTDHPPAKQCVVIDGVRVGEYDIICENGSTEKSRYLIFSQDGCTLAFGARSDRALWWRITKLP